MSEGEMTMNNRIRQLAAIVALGASAAGFAAGPSSANYAIPSSTINAGVGPMSSASYKLSSSLGDPFFAGALTSASYRINSGFWGTITGVLPGCVLDIDGNGAIDPLTDGLLILRTMFGLTGTAVTAGSIAGNATRKTWADIQPFIQLGQLDIDQNGSTEAATDGLLIMRAMFGWTGTAVTNGALGVGAQRADWTAIRAYLNTSCGAAFAQ